MNYTDLLSGSHCVSGWTWRVEPYAHKGFTLWYVMDGNGTLQYGDTVHRISAGDAFLFDYGKRLDAFQDEADPLSVYFVDFCISGETKLHGLPYHVFSGEDSILPALMKRILGCFLNEEYPSFTVFLNAALEEYERLSRAGRVTRPNRVITETCARMRAKPSEPYNIARAAAEYGYTTDHFIRLFRRETGKTPYDYLQSVRMNTAKSLLLTSNMPIQEIALYCGFDDIYAFSHFFKRKAGVSPRQYRLLQTEG